MNKQMNFYNQEDFFQSNLPLLLEKLWKLMKKETEVDATRRQSEIYEVFQKILECEGLLVNFYFYKVFHAIMSNTQNFNYSFQNSIDIKCRCNIISIVIEGIQKLPTNLMTDSEIDAILKAREQQVNQCFRYLFHVVFLPFQSILFYCQ